MEEKANIMLKKKSFIILILLLIFIWILPIPSVSTQIKFCYENILDGSFTQIYFDYGEGYNEQTSCLAPNSGDEAVLDIPLKMFYTDNDIRIDMGNEAESFVLKSIQVYKNGIKIYEIKGKEILACIDYCYNIELNELEGNALSCTAGIDSQIYMSGKFKDIVIGGQFYSAKEKIVLSCILLCLALIYWGIKRYGSLILNKVKGIKRILAEKVETATISQMEETKQIKKFINNKKNAIIILVLFAIITYGYELTNWTLTIDEEIFSFRTKSDFAKAWVGDGRWGLGLLKLLLPSHKVLPYFNGVCAVIVLIICALVFSYIVYRIIPNTKTVIIASVMFITMPIHSYYLMFDTFSVEIAVGFLCAIMSAYICTESNLKKDKLKIAIAIILLTFSVAIYQSYFLVYASIICVTIILNLINDYQNISKKKEIKEYYFLIVKSIIILAISMLIYAFVNFVLQSVFGKSSYVDGYFRWAYLDVSVCVEQMIVYLKMLFTHPEDLFEGGYILKICYLIYFVQFIILLFKSKGRRALIILAYAGLNLSICFEYILFGGHVPVRTLQILVVYCCFAAVLLSIMVEGKGWRNLVCVITCILALYQASIVVELFYSENIRQKQDENLLNRIVAEIEELNLGEMPEYPVVVTGEHSWHSEYRIQTEQFCTSMFNTGQIGRIYVWLRVQGYNYITPNEEQQHRAEEIAQDMPEWPYDGSVALVEDLIIVHLGANE